MAAENKAATLRKKIFAEHQASFTTPKVTKGDICLKYETLLEEKKTTENLTQVNEKQKNKVINLVAGELIKHWKNKKERVIEDKSAKLKLFKELKKLVDSSYEDLTNCAKKIDDDGWIEIQKLEMKAFFEFEEPKPRKRNCESLEDLEQLCLSDKDDPPYIPISHAQDEERSRNLKKYRQTIEQAMRYGMSNRQVSNIMNAMLMDLGFKDPSDVITKDKVRRMKVEHGFHLQVEHDEQKHFEFIGFDGTKSNTKEDPNKWKIVDKVTVICQAQRRYVDHFTPVSGTGIALAGCLIEVLDRYDSLDTIKAVSADGCAANTGHTNGAIRLLEEGLGRPVQWLICVLHLNELCFRHIFEFLDGATTGPTTYGGEIGSQISAKKGLKREPLNKKFIPRPGKVRNVDASLLHNKDLKNLYWLCVLVQEGPKTTNQDALTHFEYTPGVVTAARWITTASNILCLYMQETQPSEQLILLIDIIVNLYAPTLFSIKKEWHVSQGTIQVFNLIQLARNLLEKKHSDVFDIVKETVAHNGYFLHPENILLCMVTDSSLAIKRKGLAMIEKLRFTAQRRKASGDDSIRKFMVPNADDIDFKAKSYHTLIDLKNQPLELASPPILDGFTMEDLRNMNFSHDYKKVPCHSQHVERYVALTSLAGANAIGHTQRHHWILNKIQAVEKLPIGSTKQDVIDLMNTSTEKEDEERSKKAQKQQ